MKSRVEWARIAASIRGDARAVKIERRSRETSVTLARMLQRIVAVERHEIGALFVTYSALEIVKTAWPGMPILAEWQQHD